jgi:hypothetical protein
MMSPLLFAAVITLSGGPAAAEDAPKVEGKWLILYAEEGGRRNTAWEQKVATVKGTTLSFEREGKEQSLELKFGRGQMLEARGAFAEKAGAATAKAAHKGVYILGQDYFSISLGEPANGSSGSFILILRKQR